MTLTLTCEFDFYLLVTLTLTYDFDLWLWLTLTVTLTCDFDFNLWLWLVTLIDFVCDLDLWPLTCILWLWLPCVFVFDFLFLCLQSWSFVSCCLLSVYLVSLERQSNCLLVWWWVRRTVCLWVSMTECQDDGVSSLSCTMFYLWVML